MLPLFLAVGNSDSFFVQQSYSESEPVLPRVTPGDVVAGHDHDEPHTGDHLRHGSSRWVSN